MQISKTQAQPCFRANIKTFNTVDVITRLNTDDFTDLIGQIDRVQSAAPKNALLGLHFDPRNSKPWGISCATRNQPQMLHPLIFGLRLDEITHASKKVIDAAADKERKAPYYMPLADNMLVRFLKKRHIKALQQEQNVKIFNPNDIVNCLTLPALKRFQGQVEQVKQLILPNGDFAIGFDTKAIIPFVTQCKLIGQNEIPVVTSSYNVLNLQVAEKAMETRKMALAKAKEEPVQKTVEMSNTEFLARQDILHTLERG